MEFIGYVVAQYPKQTGTYMGDPWTNQSFVVTASKPRPDTNMHDRIVIKVKGKNLDDFISAGVPDGGIWKFTLELDAEEKTSPRTGEIYPINKPVVCVGFEKVNN